MSKLQWIGCLALLTAFGAPASRADEPPPFPAPSPAPGGKAAPAPAPASAAPAARSQDVRVLGSGFSDLAWVRWEGQSLRFEQSRFEAQARLYARSKDRPGWLVFPGTDLEAIVRASPTLEAHPELPALRAHVAGPASVRLVVQGFALAYDHDLETGEARLFTRSPQGETMWPGTDLATTAAQSPEVTRLAEWPAFEARVHAATAAALPLRFRPGQGGVAIAVFGPQDVTLTLHTWRGRGWQPRSFRGPSLAQLVRANPDLDRTLEVGDATTPTYPTAPGTTTVPPPPRSPAPAPAPRTYPPGSPSSPPGGGSSCGAGGKSCGR